MSRPKSLQDLQRQSNPLPINSKPLLSLLRRYRDGKLPPGHDGWRILTKAKLWDKKKGEWSLLAKVTLDALQRQKEHHK